MTRAQALPIRVGYGFDVHRLIEGRALILGGIEIPHEKGLDGHSDADVALHALMDALLGALNLRDIGFHFPPSDECYRGADSKVLLAEVYQKIREEGYVVGQVDLTIMAERPKINPHIPRMQEVIAGLLEISEKEVSIKATTTERLGFTGREEGISAAAVCTLYRADFL